MNARGTAVVVVLCLLLGGMGVAAQGNGPQNQTIHLSTGTTVAVERAHPPTLNASRLGNASLQRNAPLGAGNGTGGAVGEQQAEQRIQRASRAIDRAAADQAALNRTVHRLATANISLPAATDALAAASGNLSRARAAHAAAESALAAGNHTQAAVRADAAWRHAVTADRTVQLAAADARGRISAQLGARIAALGDDIAAARRTVEQVERRYGENSTAAETARGELREARQAMERSRQRKQETENASTVEELASSSAAAADDVQAASDSLQRTKETVKQANRAFYQRIRTVAVLVALLSAGGFLYYRIDRDEWKKHTSWDSG